VPTFRLKRPPLLQFLNFAVFLKPTTTLAISTAYMSVRRKGEFFMDLIAELHFDQLLSVN